MNNVKIALIGYGSMGASHADKIFKGEIKNGTLAAVCDPSAERLELAKTNFGKDFPTFETLEQLFQNSDIFDAVVIVSPHYEHVKTAVTAFEHGKHVLVEKPAGVYTKEVLEMNAAAKKSGKTYAIMYQQRTIDKYKKLKELIDSGELGAIKRFTWIITDWYRPQAYHDSASWRSSWKYEGGGTLINQCPHQLDLWQWLVGMPTRIISFNGYGKYHDIEVEDEVIAHAEYANGMTAQFIASTGEAPGTNRLEIACDMGKIVLETGQPMIFYRNTVSERVFEKTNKERFGSPEAWKCEIPVTGAGGSHGTIIANFVDNILNGTPLIAPGEEGINGLTLSNAMHLSSFTGQWVDLPIDHDLFFEHLQQKIKNSKKK